MNEDMDIVLIDHHINGSKAQNIYTYDICIPFVRGNKEKNDPKLVWPCIINQKLEVPRTHGLPIFATMFPSH